MMKKVGCLVNLVGFVGSSVLKFDLAGFVNKKGRIKVLDCK